MLALMRLARVGLAGAGGGGNGGGGNGNAGSKGNAPANQTAGGPGSRSEEDRNKWRKDMLDKTSPSERARWNEYFGAVDRRRQALGLPGGGSEAYREAYPNYDLIRRTQHAFADVALAYEGVSSWDLGSESRPLKMARVTASFFPTMRVLPTLGRAFEQREQHALGEVEQAEVQRDVLEGL